METRPTRRRWMRRLLVLAIPAAALPVTMAAPASAEADQAACVSVWTTSPNVQTGCGANSDTTPPHVVGLQVCADVGTASYDEDPNGDLLLDPTGTSVVATSVGGGTVWVEGEGDLVNGRGGVNVGSGSNAVGVSDDVGTQCNPGDDTP